MLSQNCKNTNFFRPQKFRPQYFLDHKILDHKNVRPEKFQTTILLDHKSFRPQYFFLDQKIFKPQKQKNENEKQARMVFPFESQTYEANKHKKTVKYTNVYYAFIALYHYKESLYQ